MAGLIILGVLLAVVAVIVVSVARGRPKRPPHPPGTLVRTYRRGGRSYQRHVDYRIRSGRPRRRR
ncbi:MAG: hypothetical protein ACJ735_08730 [Actinomycetes bacterium]